MLLSSRRAGKPRDETSLADTPRATILTGLPMTSERILVADDDPALCLLLRETLQDAGYEVSIANDGDQLVRMAQDQPPDLLLIDLMMPLMDGFEATHALRQTHSLSDLAIVAMTANAMESDKQACLAAGMNDYVAKPVSPQHLYGV